MKKREGVKPSPSGKSIIFDFYYKEERHRETIKKEPTAANLNWAEIKHTAVMAEIANEAAGGAPFDYAKHFPNSKWLERQQAPGGPAAVLTLKTALDEWFTAQRYEKPTVIRQYRGFINKLVDFFGDDKPVTEVNQVREIERYIRSMQDTGLEVKSIHNRMIPLYSMLQRAARDEVIESNAMDKLEKLEPSEKEKIRRNEDGTGADPFDLDEIRAVSKVYAGRPLLNLFLVGVWTGLRLGELLALSWENIDWVHGLLYVKSELSEGRYVTPKNREAIRIIELLPQAIAALHAQKQFTFLKEPIDCGPFGKRSIVFYQPTMAHPFERSQQLTCRLWPGMLKHAGVRYRPPKHMRHSFASLCISAGEPKTWIRNQMGHVDDSMIDKHYGRWLAQAAAAAGNTGGSRVKQLVV